MAKKQGMDARFERAEPGQRKHRTILRVCGERGTGKTRLGLTAPGPILYQSFDDGLEGVIEQFLEENSELFPGGRTDIYPKQYQWNPGDYVDADGDIDPDTSKAAARALRDEFEEDLKFALENGVRTVVHDKETDIWELYRYAQFGGPSDAPKDYPALNQRYMSMINRVKRYDTNLILIQGLKDEWVTKKRTNAQGQVKESPSPSGKRVPSGFGRLDEIVFAELYCRREGKEFFFEFYSENDQEFGKVRQNASLCGERLSVNELPNRSFCELGTLLIPGSEVEDWA